MSLTLRPFTDANEALETMTQLRHECGWDAEKVPEWIRQAQQGDRINLACEVSQQESENKTVVVGMISLVLRDDDYQLNIDKCLANPETKTAMIKSLFIRHAYQRKGYGKESILQLEKFAASKYGIEIMALDTAASDVNNMASIRNWVMSSFENGFQ
ncbi:hypothetical protein BCR33DRAFT_852355 [Rhizoclosmatium globosum]|uniref:N-acetyltransferase domain-containing protein n=1 Tax=Rhizoclosmatium globosum TaxID=329046 RepID=A0A1Y2C3A9_9FUNG|nr:hypothetical protein BCR33DRAFT_852355 [Rhizoclosmatium globosum]|eukprot:ORY41377.1 hypothetical protein BCR33DRAFT_852355 [Rhizoclosmatium globosum]